MYYKILSHIVNVSFFAFYSDFEQIFFDRSLRRLNINGLNIRVINNNRTDMVICGYLWLFHTYLWLFEQHK